jgi:archaellum component FlaC
MRDEYMKSL